MQIISWNVNGLRAVNNKNLFVPFIKQFEPDVLCLQETKAEKGQAVIDLPEYDEYWNSSTRKKGYAGTAIFIKKTHKVHSVLLGFPKNIVLKYHLTDSYGDANAEGRVIAVELDDFYVVNCYTPNSKPDLSRIPFRHELWDPAFLAYCTELEKSKPVIFCGDLNVAHTEEDLANPKENEGKHGFTEEEREGVDKIMKAGFIDTFRHFTPEGKGYYTWWSHFAYSRDRNIGWRIDYIFTSKKLLPLLKSAYIEPDTLGSDHCPIRLILKDK